MNFQQTLATLPSIEHLARIDLVTADNELIASIPNQPGKQGSLAVYHALQQQFGELNPTAAEQGLTLFCEHTEHARQHPGSHPNIDLLFRVIDQQLTLSINLVNSFPESTE